ncbi:NAD(P)-binding protein [Lipomyces doorenjongii]
MVVQTGLTMTPEAPTKSPELVSRSDLKKRAIPHMVLSDGSDHSLTPAPVAALDLDSSVSATRRFTVTGNAIVTGGAGALGFATCVALLEHGLQGLMIFDVNLTQSSEQITALKARFPSTSIHVLQVDVTDEEAVSSAVELTARTLGSIEHLLCFVGIVGCVNAIDMMASQWRKILDVNLTGSFLCAQAVAKRMIQQGKGGSIIFTSSISAHRVNYPQPQAAYNVSKSALLMLKSCLAAEWARWGIRTNTISPGYMDTILNEGDGIAEARRTWCERNPSGRMGVPSELTSTAVMLSSHGATYINGTDIVVDGGGIVF